MVSLSKFRDNIVKSFSKGKVVDITDEEMAKTLKKTLSQIESLKQTNEKEYKVLKTGVLCKKLNLDEDDLEKIYNIRTVGSKEYC